MQDLKLGQRGYLLTRSDAFLAPYEQARAAIPQALGNLRPLVADNPDQKARVERMGALIDKMLTRGTKTVELGRNGQFAEATEFVKTGHGQQILEFFRALVAEFSIAENDLLGKRQAAESAARAIMLGLVLIGLATAAAALGALLAGGVAQDFNNLMTVVIGNLDSVERRVARSGPADAVAIGRPIAAAMQGAKRAASLTQRLLAFSRQQVLAPQKVDLNHLVASLSEMLTRTVGETIAVETILGSGLWPTFADVSQLENAIVNLVVNARDAMPQGGRITIETANASLDEAYCARFGDVAAGQYVLLSVTDAGTGISPENLSKVFELFFTTKSASTSTGLGPFDDLRLRQTVEKPRPPL